MLLRELIPALAQEGVIIEEFGSDTFLIRVSRPSWENARVRRLSMILSAIF